MLGKGTEAAQYFLEAKQFRPDDELAVTNEVLAYHLLAKKKTRQKSGRRSNAFPIRPACGHCGFKPPLHRKPMKSCLKRRPPPAKRCRGRLSTLQEGHSQRLVGPRDRTCKRRHSGQAEVVTSPSSFGTGIFRHRRYGGAHDSAAQSGGQRKKPRQFTCGRR